MYYDVHNYYMSKAVAVLDTTNGTGSTNYDTLGIK